MTITFGCNEPEGDQQEIPSAYIEIPPINSYSNLGKDGRKLLLKRVSPDLMELNYQKQGQGLQIISNAQSSQAKFQILGQKGDLIYQYEVQGENLVFKLGKDVEFNIPFKHYLEINNLIGEFLDAEKKGNEASLKKIAAKLEKVKGPEFTKGSISIMNKMPAILDPQLELLPELSHELGLLRIMGHTSPPSFPLHVMAFNILSSSKLDDPGIKIDPKDSSSVSFRQQLPPIMDFIGYRNQILDLGANWGISTEDKPSICDDPHAPKDILIATEKQCNTINCQEYPNREEGCIGMCGLGCKCAKKICGDCCFHRFCYQHDLYGRVHGGALKPTPPWWNPLLLLPWWATVGC